MVFWMTDYAIVGSRLFPNPLARLRSLDIYPPDRIISGGASGVDAAAERFAKERGIDIEIIRPIDPTDKISYLFRNVEILTKADEIIAVWNGRSRGTKFVIDYAKARGKKLTILSDETQRTL